MSSLSFTLSFKGDRNYIQGADLYRAALEAASQTAPFEPDERLRFSARRFTKRQCSFEVGIAPDPQAAPPRPDNHVAELILENRSRRLEVLVRETDAQTLERQPYDEDRVIRGFAMDRSVPSITLERPEFGNGIEVLVALNKKLHQTLFPLIGKKWVFTRLEMNRRISQTIEDSAHSPGPVTVVHLSSFHGKITKNEIRWADETTGWIYFSAVPEELTR